jgi:glycosyltransferase involved in cell wall biosynthesis
MKVHHIINSYSRLLGGAERIVRALHTGLSLEETESALLGIERHTDDAIQGARSLSLKSAYSFKAFNNVRLYVRDEVDEGDLVHAHLFPASFYVSILKQLGCIEGRTVLTEHSTHNGRRQTWLGAIIDFILYRGFDQVVAISTGVQYELLKWQPGLEGNVSVVANGLPPRFSAHQYRNPRAKPVLLSIGSLREAKNYSNMLAALALLNDYDLEYWIAGEGAERAKLKVLVGQLGLSSRVKFLGYIEDTKPLLERADIFLMASSWEGFGLAAVEAMNASLPCVLSDVSGMRELAGDGRDAAVLVDPRDKEDIARGIERLLNSEDLRRTMGELAYRESERFSEAEMLEQYQSVYRELSRT